MGRGECGNSDVYPHDMWDKKLKQCVYRKCAATCPETRKKYFNSTKGYRTEYERNIYCCQGDFCNTSSNLNPKCISFIGALFVFIWIMA